MRTLKIVCVCVSTKVHGKMGRGAARLSDRRLVELKTTRTLHASSHQIATLHIYVKLSGLCCNV